MRTVRPPVALTVALGALLVLTGCGGGPPAAPSSGAGSSGAGPLGGGPGGGRAPLATAVPTGPCPSPPAAVSEAVEGLVLPDGAFLTEVVRQGPLVQVRGWVAQTPVQLRAQYEDRTDVEVLTLEDETVEVETLVSDGEHRTYLRGTAVCPSASRLDGLVSRETG